MPDFSLARLRRHAARFACFLLWAVTCTFPVIAEFSTPAVVTPPSPPEEDPIFAHASDTPYVEVDKSTDMRASARREIVQLQRMRRNGELDQFPPERKKSIEEMLARMSDTATQLVEDEARQTRMARAAWIDSDASTSWS